MEEAITALGANVGTGTVEDRTDRLLGTEKRCRYQGQFREELDIDVYANPGDQYPSMKAQLEAAIGPAAEVPGIGDSAYTYGDEVCHVLKGKYLLGISVLGPPGGGARDRLVTVCRSAADRLSA